MHGKLLVIGTGGTISVAGSAATDFLDYPMSGMRVPISVALDRIPSDPCLPEVLSVDLPPVSSTEIGPAVWGQLMGEIDKVADDVQGIVVAHGTGTLEETAFALELFSKTSIPSVLTGAQRPLDAISSDAPYNLWSALRVAATPEAAEHGWLVAMDQKVHAAADVSKQDNLALDAFTSGPVGPLGSIEDGSVVFRRNSKRFDPELQWRGEEAWPRVEIVMTYAGADGAAIDAAVSAGARGIVLVGLAPGYATPLQRDALRTARRKGVEVVMASRAAAGLTIALEQNGIEGLIGSRRLNPAKARILLAASIMNHATTHEIDDLFAAFA